jgi:hypothetical protein
LIVSGDPGRQYIWSEQAIDVLVRLGVENWESVIRQVDVVYERERRKGTVRNPARLARTMVRRAGLSALRVNSVRHRGRRRPILQVPIERPDPESGDTVLLVDERPGHWGLPPDAALDELRNRLEREEEQGDHQSLLEQMRRRLGERLLGDSEVSCPVHERGCPHPANVLASAQRICTSLGNALRDQETGEWEPVENQPSARSRADWDQRMHQRLLHLAADAARAIDADRYGSTQAGRQARARVARCVLYVLWCDAVAVEFSYFADQLHVALRWVYVQQLERNSTSEQARRRLLGWLEDTQPPQSDAERNQS